MKHKIKKEPEFIARSKVLANQKYLYLIKNTMIYFLLKDCKRRIYKKRNEILWIRDYIQFKLNHTDIHIHGCTKIVWMFVKCYANKLMRWTCVKCILFYVGTKVHNVWWILNIWTFENLKMCEVNVYSITRIRYQGSTNVWVVNTPIPLGYWRQSRSSTT